MPLETSVSSIADLNPLWPTAADPKSDGDDHIRYLKSVLKITFPLFTGAMLIPHDQVASKDYVNQTAFTTALPAQPGGTTLYEMTSLAGSAGWRVADIYTQSTRIAQVAAISLALS